MTILRLCTKCGATVDPRAEGNRGPCRRCGRERDQQHPWKQRRKIRSGWEWGRLRTLVHERDRTCVVCGETNRLQVHHRIPLRDGGTNQLSNLELRCETHHKHAPAKSRSSTRLTARHKNSVMPLASTLMTWTSEPLACPHCEAQIQAYEDVLTLFLSRVGLIVVGCATCRRSSAYSRQ